VVPEILVKTVPVAFSPDFSGTLKSSRSRLEVREQNKYISFLFPKTKNEKLRMKEVKRQKEIEKEVKMERERGGERKKVKREREKRSKEGKRERERGGEREKEGRKQR
jgi:hypothetical protein